ncbi:hypothetical protein G9A89_018558 [Geosiphon pyriformis]|nr:hypothetical protein G9A89_018558 [Geosiphon pyriformis]
MSDDLDLSERHPIHESFRRLLARFPLKMYRSLYRNPILEKSVLYIWGPGWQGKNQKASFDQDCLKWQTYFLFSEVEFDVKNANEPLMSPSGNLPFLISTTGEVFSEEQLEEYIKIHLPETPESTDQQIADAEAFIALADTKLRTALLFYLWCEPANYEKTTRSRYGGHYAKPLNHILMWQAKRTVVQDLLTRKAILDADEIYEEAAEALNAISVALGDSVFFFGSSVPKFIDAVIFSYIYTILSIPTSTAKELNELVQKHKNLMEFSRKIYSNYYERLE